MREYDDAVLECFLKNQGQLFPEPVAETLEEAEEFLEDCMATVAESLEEVLEYFEEVGVDLEGAEGEEVLENDEVFDVGDGRYLIVEG
ncbi:MAG: glyoxalase [Lachnospiraceae bacterium]|jgi:tyrosine-protein phosphatase YwqE|nr:glyoxalase [Lachnospiraceae bacterium]MBR3508234.1 glyoxalase [Lachnospiraceae bacterium]